jgi:diguanylate cyclase (GGDEF)-like protein
MQLSIRHRGILVIAIPIVTIVTIILGAISTQNGVQNGLRTTSSELLPLVEVLGEVESSLSVAHAESMRQILLSMSGVKGEPFDRQSQRTQAATEWAIDALRTARSMSTTHGAFDDSELLDLYIEQQTNALEMAAIDPSTGRLLYTAADNTFAELLDELHAAADLVREEARTIGQNAEAKGERATLYFSLAAVLGAVLTIGVMASTLRAITVPLVAMTGAMKRLSNNDMQVKIAYHGRRDEIGAMAQAMEVFRSNAIERRELEAQAAAQREAEKLALARQRAEEERLRMTARLKHEFGKVIGAASSGDFTRRIDTRFADENLDALSQDINRLVGTVEDGVATAQAAVRALATGQTFDGDKTMFSGAFAEMFENIEECSRQIRKQAKSLQYNARHDALTELPNRRYLEEFLTDEKERIGTANRSYALLHIDLDRFKQINDSLGHHAGDAVLKRAADILRCACRGSDFAARIGGDEFVIFCAADQNDVTAPNPLRNRSEEIADRIVEFMRRPFDFDGVQVRSGASVGIALCSASEFDPTELMVSADLALYEAKNKGRGKWHLFTPDLHHVAISRKHMADDILRALEADEFVPYFQPQVYAGSHSIAGLEALARWQHPKLGLLPPADFIPIAEEVGVISRIDQIVAEKAAGAVNRMREQHGINVPRLSLNLSFAQIQDKDPVSVLKRLRSPNFKICVELLESVFYDDLNDQEAWLIDDIASAGIDVEIDDFGSGHASISSLMRLRPARLKIDRSIVKPLIDLPEQHRLISAIIDMAHALDIGVIAEGVETMEHAKLLEKLGCPILQGYAFARPCDEASFVELCQNDKLSRALG